MRLDRVFAVGLLALMVSFPSSASVIVYTSLSSWQTALGSGVTPVIDGLEDGSFNLPLSLINHTGTHVLGFSGGLMSDQIDAIGTDNSQTVFDFGSTGITAFGGFFNLGNSNNDPGLTVTLNTSPNTILNTALAAQLNDFWGIISTDSFTTLTLTAGSNKENPNHSQNYTVDSLYYYGAPAGTLPPQDLGSEAPEPATMLTLGAGLIGVAAFARRRKRA
jgi:hypothetical protein